MRAVCRPERAFPVRCRSTVQVPDAVHARVTQSAPQSATDGNAPNFIGALERRYTDEQARYVPAETSSARREAMKLFSARVTSNLATNLPAARNYYELAKALKCLTPELCEKTLPIALRENDRRWTVAIYSDWEALAPGQIPITSVAGAFRALAPFCLWSRLTTILESLTVRGLRLPDSSVIPAMRGASVGTHPDAHAFVLTAMRLGYAAPGLLDAAMRRTRPNSFSEQRTSFFIQAMQENDLPSHAALQHYCDVLARTQELDLIQKLLLAAKKLMPLNAALLFHLVEASAHRRNLATLETALDELRKSNVSVRHRTAKLVVACAVKEPSLLVSPRLFEQIIPMGFYGDCNASAAQLIAIGAKLGVKWYPKNLQRLQVMQLLHEGKKEEAEALWRKFPEPRPRFPLVDRSEQVQIKYEHELKPPAAST